MHAMCVCTCVCVCMCVWEGGGYRDAIISTAMDCVTAPTNV